MMRNVLVLAVMLVSAPYFSVATAQATAARIDVATCQDLKGEQQKFIETGILADLQRGPEWAKTNLSQERLRQVELYIMLDEQLKFGCREAKFSLELEKPGEAGKQTEGNPAAGPNAPKAAKSKSKPPVAKDNAEGVVVIPQKVKPEKSVGEQPRPKTAKPPKPKANDAYVPPPPGPGSSPGAGGGEGSNISDSDWITTPKPDSALGVTP